jgi:hypothetical protein
MRPAGSVIVEGLDRGQGGPDPGAWPVRRQNQPHPGESKGQRRNHAIACTRNDVKIEIAAFDASGKAIFWTYGG